MKIDEISGHKDLYSEKACSVDADLRGTSRRGRAIARTRIAPRDESASSLSLVHGVNDRMTKIPQIAADK
jgi:hypothetical protein